MRTITLLLSAYIGKLNNAEYLNLMSRLRALIETATPEGVGLTAGEMTEFSELVDQLQARVNYTTASALTGQLDDLEKQRDSLLTFLFATINSGVSLPIAAQSEAAKALELIIRPYKNTQSLPDQQETVVINGLLADLGADSAETALATLGQTAIVAELKKINDQYAELTAQRSRDSEARAVATESAGSLRKRIDPLFEAIRQIAQAESIANPTAATAEFVLAFNGLVREVDRLYNLRTGNTQAEGGGETVIPGTDPGESEGEGGEQSPEPTDPEEGGEETDSPSVI